MDLLYLHPALYKAVASGTGEQRGGDYIARVQIGYEKDNSPKYRYFKTQKEYDSYLAGKKGKTKGSKDKKKDSKTKDLKEKLATEHKKVKEKETGKQFSSKQGLKREGKHGGGVFVKEKKQKKLNKGLALYIGVDIG